MDVLAICFGSPGLRGDGLALERLEAGRTPVTGEGHAEGREERERLRVGLRARRERHVEAAHLVDVVVVDLREDDLLPDAHGVVAPPVERARVEPAEVAQSRQGDRDEAVEELVRALVAQRDGEPDRHALAQLERRHGLAGAPDVRLLPRDVRQLLGGGVEHLGVLLGLADAHVERHLLQARGLHRRGVAELAHQGGADLVVVAFLDTCHEVLVQLCAGALGDAHAVAALVTAHADARRLVVLRVHDRHVGDVDRALLLDHAHRGVGPARRRAHVALDHVDTLDVDPIALGLGADDLARAPLVLAGDHDHGVVGADLHHSTSGASETIFMNPPSRSSRATGPKMRVPRGLFWASMITAAFSSKAMYVPSSRPNSFFVRTTTAFTTSPFLTVPFGLACLTVATMMSPTPA